MKIILNGQEVEIHGKGRRRLTYEEIAAMAYQPTVTYAKAHGKKPEGILTRHGNVMVVEGTVIDCMRTGAA